MIAVTAPTGNIGPQVVKHLLDAGEAVRVVARNPAKIVPEVREKVEAVQGSRVVPPSFQDNATQNTTFVSHGPRAVRSRAGA